MAYSKRIAACVIGPGNKIYDEDPKGVIVLPFDKEFKIRVINKNEKKIGFDIYIDGIKATKAGRIIVNPHDKIDLERWVENDDKGAKFRFVAKDSQESKEAGMDKEPYTGVVEIRSYFEKEKPLVIKEYHYYDHLFPKTQIWYTTTNAVGTYTRGVIQGYSGYSGSSGTKGYSGISGVNSASCHYTSSNPFMTSKLNLQEGYTKTTNEGVVVSGSNSNQSFYSTYVELEEDYVSLKMYLMGYKEEPCCNVINGGLAYSLKEDRIKSDAVDICDKALKNVKQEDIQFCTNCGKKILPIDNFCGQCGLQLRSTHS